MKQLYMEITPTNINFLTKKNNNDNILKFSIKINLKNFSFTRS